MASTESAKSGLVAHSLSAYLRMVRRIRREWGLDALKELWFRAEDQRYYPTRLQPGLYRPKEGQNRKPVSELLELENRLYREFDRCLPQLSDVRLQDDEWDPYFLMQHHGVPTRILDWSDSALIALHFAVRDKLTPIRSASLIYILDPYWLLDLLKEDSDRKDAIRRWEKYRKGHPQDVYEDDWDRLYFLLATPKAPLLWDAPHVSRRVAAQRSRFLIFGTDPCWLSKLGEKKSSRVCTIEIRANKIEDIKQELRDAGMTESVVYPDLDGIGRELRQIWEAKR